MKKYWLIFLLGIGVSLFPDMATATTYRTASKQTTLVLHERQTNPSGYYFTTYEGQELMGFIEIDEAQGSPGTYYYRGKFRDTILGSDRRMTCEGNITIARQSIGRTNQLGAKVTWQITGGESCASIGQTFALDLEEALPRPTASGDFTPDRANTWLSQTAGLGTWPKWRVVSGDGKLDCRNSPTGEILSVYQTGGEIGVEGRVLNSIDVVNGVPWLWTDRRCYVRANSRYIEPISLPW